MERERKMPSATVPMTPDLQGRLEGLRGAPLESYALRAEDVPCNEISDAGRLCRQPLVSVVMCTYNHERYVRDAIEGVMSQKADFEVELLVSEDCSTDATLAICRECQARHPEKIRVLWAERNVFSEAGGWRRALCRCRGRYLAVCEGDDYWTDPNKLQKQVDLLRQNPSAGICFGGIDIYEEYADRLLRYDGSRAPKSFMGGREFCWRLLFEPGDRGIYIQNLHTSTFLVRMDAFRRAEATYPELYGWKLLQGDFLLLYTVATLSDVCFLREQVSVYRMNDGGVTRRMGMRSLLDGDFLKVYLTMCAFGWSYQTAVNALSDLLVTRWTKIALQLSPEGQRSVGKRLAASADLDRFFSRFHCRAIYRAICAGRLTKSAYRMMRPVYTLVAHFHKTLVRIRLRRLDETF